MLQDKDYFRKIEEFCTGKINIYDYVEIVPNKTFDICEYCGIFSPGTEHYKNNHFDISGLLRCCLCLYEIRKFNYPDLIIHLRYKHGYAFRCGFCVFKRSDYCQLKDRHYTKHSSIFHCEMCKTSHLNFKRMERHLIDHFIDDIFKDLEIVANENLKCFDAVCEHISESIPDLKDHGSNDKNDVLDHIINDHSEIFGKFKKYLEENSEN